MSESSTPAYAGNKNKTKSITHEISDEKYRGILEETALIYVKMNRSFLKFYWNVGERANLLTQVSQSESYSKKLIPKFCEDLERDYDIAVGVDSMYKAAMVNRALTKDQLKLAVESKMSLHQVLPLCAKSVEAPMRQEILEEHKEAQERQEPYNVQNSLNAKRGISTSPTSAKDGAAKTPKKPMSGIKQIALLFQKTEGQLVMYGDCVELICKDTNVEDMQQAKDYYAEACTAMSNLIDAWSIQRAKCDKSFDTIATALK